MSLITKQSGVYNKSLGNVKAQNSSPAINNRYGSPQPRLDEDEIRSRLSALKTSIRSHVTQHYDLKPTNTTFSAERLYVKLKDQAGFGAVIQHYIAFHLFNIMDRARRARGSVTPVTASADGFLPNLERYAKIREQKEKNTRTESLDALIEAVEKLGTDLRDYNYDELTFGGIDLTKTHQINITVFPYLKRGEKVISQQDTQTVNGTWKSRSKFRRALAGIPVFNHTRDLKRTPGGRNRPAPPSSSQTGTRTLESSTWLFFIFFLDIIIFMLSRLRMMLCSYCELKEDWDDMGLLEESETRELSTGIMDALTGHFEKRVEVGHTSYLRTAFELPISRSSTMSESNEYERISRSSSVVYTGTDVRPTPRSTPSNHNAKG